MFRRMPLFKLLTIGQTVLLARRHFKRLDAHDRRRLAQVVRRGPGMSRDDRDELRHSSVTQMTSSSPAWRLTR